MKKLKLVAVWNPKGGQGKSMLALNLAAAACEMGLKPLVVDQDQQGTAMLYFKSGNLPFQVVPEVPAERPNVDIVIFDHQASDWELPDTRLLVMPLKPARDQFATYMDAFKRAGKAGKNIITVVTDGQTHRASEKEVMTALKDEGAFIIPSSGVFSRAAAEYKTIYDESMNRAYKVGERRREISRILGAILMEDTGNE